MKLSSVFRIFTGIWIYLNTFALISCQEEDAATPRFLTRSKTHRVVSGDTAVLPCRVDRLADYIILWKRGASVLSAGDMKITRDPRMYLVDGFNLEIRNIRPVDGGDYICQISTLVPHEQVHVLEVLVPPKVQIDPATSLSVTKGETITIHCRVSGNPVPTVTWTRKNNLLPTGQQFSEGNSLTFLKADRHTAGTYMCTADNGVNIPATSTIDINVLYAPEIELEKSRVHSREGKEATLVCIVHADPPVTKFRWYQDTMMLEPDGHWLMESRGSRHSLTIRNVKTADFGNYSCEAYNKIGRAMKQIELSGKPSQPVFRSDPVGRQSGSFNVTWTVESFYFIDEYRLSYRQKFANGSSSSGPGVWHDVVIPISDKVKSPSAMKSGIHWSSYFIRNLEPTVPYEAKVIAKNKFGWGLYSDIFQFNVKRAEFQYSYDSSPQHDVLSEPEVRDMSMLSSSSSSSSSSFSFLPLLHIVIISAICMRSSFTWNWDG